MALGTLATIALATSAAAGIGQAVEARNARKANEAALERQEQKALAEAGLKSVLDDTGAEIELGSSSSTSTSSSQKRRRRTTRSSTTSNVVGGISTASRVGF